ncbi:MAG: bifunctional phosphoribosylaminoimidazolecarboxamide formyltransferase/IMP cyclohydrolase [Gemmatimonadota bacterium]
MRNALISVSDKTAIIEFAAALVEHGWRILSTGGTRMALEEAAIPVTGVAAFTGFPEVMGGRVKTLHPAIHAGLLARRSVEADGEDLARLGFEPIDLVAVNLYPFRETVARESTTLAEALEQIDIGGPTMLRAAAKNHPFVWAICDPADYPRVVEAIASTGDAPELRRELAARVFAHVAAYDAAISGYLRLERTPEAENRLPPEVLLSLVRVESLRYGENPDQEAAFYRNAGAPSGGIPSLRQLHGKALSYNNLLDLDGAISAIEPFLEEEGTACAVLKHTTPCGLALGRSPVEALDRAWACDPVSAFGSTIAFSEPVTEAVAERLADVFVECVVAPGYAPEALRRLQEKKNLRILEPQDAARFARSDGHLVPGVDVRGIRGGALLQTSPAPARPAGLRGGGAVVATARAPDEAEWKDLAFAWAAVQGVKSNAIVLARDGATIGIGAGQMSRVDAVRLAVQKASDAGLSIDGAVLASDAFFPFRDGLDAAAEAGVRAVVQPGGSVRDGEVTQAADEHGVAMVMTGRRLFRH